MRRSAPSGHLPSAAGEGGRTEPVHRFAVSATCGESAFPALWRGPGVGCLSRGHQPRAGWRFRPLVRQGGIEPPALILEFTQECLTPDAAYIGRPQPPGLIR